MIPAHFLGFPAYHFKAPTIAFSAHSISEIAPCKPQPELAFSASGHFDPKPESWERQR
jgi:hypothetical protein